MRDRILRIEGLGIIACTISFIAILCIIYALFVIEPLDKRINTLIDENSKLNYDMAVADELASDPGQLEQAKGEENTLRDDVFTRVAADPDDRESIMLELLRRSGLKNAEIKGDKRDNEELAKGDIILKIVNSHPDVTAKGDINSGLEFLKQIESFPSGIFAANTFAFSEGKWMFQLTFSSAKEKPVG